MREHMVYKHKDLPQLVKEREVQIKDTGKYYFTPVRIIIIKKPENSKLGLE